MTIRIKDGGFVSLERGPDEKDWTRLEEAEQRAREASNAIEPPR